MITVGDIHIFVSDFAVALRFWRDGVGLSVVAEEASHSAPFAALEFAAGGPLIRVFGGAQAWPPDERPAVGSRPTVRFDMVTDTFDATLARMLEHGGEQVDEIEEYDGLRFATIADPDGNSFELVELPQE